MALDCTKVRRHEFYAFDEEVCQYYFNYFIDGYQGWNKDT